MEVGKHQPCRFHLISDRDVSFQPFLLCIRTEAKGFDIVIVLQLTYPEWRHSRIPTSYSALSALPLSLSLSTVLLVLLNWVNMTTRGCKIKMKTYFPQDLYAMWTQVCVRLEMANLVSSPLFELIKY